MNSYLELKNKQQEEFDAFPMFFAFNTDQFAEGMKSLGLEIDDTDKVYKGPSGMIYKKTDSPLLKEMTERHTKETEDAIKADTKGDGYILDMFSYELSNHEYCYTRDPTGTLDAVGVTLTDLQNNKALRDGYNQAIRIQSGYYNMPI